MDDKHHGQKATGIIPKCPAVPPSESMSKSKKNTIYPEHMIKNHGADAVRWFILSDSPPEKDIQWSDVGVASANKFLQKIWNLNFVIKNKTFSRGNRFYKTIFRMSVPFIIFKI